MVNIKVPDFKVVFNFLTSIRQVFRGSLFYTRMITKELAFIAITAFGFLLLMINGFEFGSYYGTPIYPTTYSMLALMETFNLFFLIIVVYYTGELVWKERNVMLHQINDASPVKDFSILSAKFLSLIWIYLFLIVVLILTGMFFQVIHGYYKFEIGLYFESLLTETFAFLILFTLLGFFIQVLVNHKFLGYALFIVFFIATEVIQYIGLEHKLFQKGVLITKLDNIEAI